MSSVTPGCGSTTAISASPNSVVGNAEHRAVVHAGNRMQRGLDLGGIDVDAARDHHVALAVADEDIAVRVDIADVARGDEAVAIDLGALLRLVVIGEIRIARDPRIDLADLALRQLLSVVADEAQLRARRNLADGAGLLQRVLGIGEGDRAGFGRAVEFVDHRPPPFDHRALDVGGTGRGGMDDVAQRRHVVFPAHLLRQLHQPDEHGRHHEDGVDLLGLDQPQEFLRVEPRHQHQRAAETAGAQAERVRRGMIQRPRQQRAGARLQAVDHPAHPLGVGGLLRRRRVAPHPLGMACGARGVDHVLRLRHAPGRHSAGAASARIRNRSRNRAWRDDRDRSCSWREFPAASAR